MSVHCVTGYSGTSHIKASDWGALNASLFGSGRYVCGVGEKFSYSLTSSTLIRIKDGVAIDQGRQIEIEAGDYENLEIATGTTGVNRNDLVVLYYEKDTSTGKEIAGIKIIQGTSGTTATDPDVTQGDIYDGATYDEFPLYRIKIEGVNVTAVEQLFDVMASLNSLYPVGSIYMSTQSTDPSTIIGGTWTRIMDKFLLAGGDTYEPGTEGGSNTMTSDMMPSHTHQLESTNGSHTLIAGTQSKAAAASGSTLYVPQNIYGYHINATGADETEQVGNNMPAYLSVYMWVRTA